MRLKNCSLIVLVMLLIKSIGAYCVNEKRLVISYDRRIKDLDPK
jgi:hypothetical protein